MSHQILMILILSIMAFSFNIIIFLMRPVLADDINPGLYASNSKPFGIPFVNWTAKWWQWWLKIPNSQHPFSDTTGERCATAQEGPVWYLLGAAGKVERNCVISSDKAILFPILDTACSYSESPNLKNEQELRVCAVDGNKGAIVNALIDGRQVKDLDKYRVTTGLFNVTYSEDPVTPTNSNESQAVSDGWFLFLEPLKPGQHEIKFTASQFAQQNTAEPEALMDVTYHLTVEDNSTKNVTGH